MTDPGGASAVMTADPLGNPLTVGVVVTVLHDGTLYLSSYDTDIRDAVGMKSTALSVDAFKGELTEIAKHGSARPVHLISAVAPASSIKRSPRNTRRAEEIAAISAKPQAHRNISRGGSPIDNR